MQIRPFQPSDERAVIDLWQACDLTRSWNDPHKDIARKLAVGPELFLVGEVDAAVMASAMGGYDGHRGWVNYLAVHPAYQRRGFGQALMRSIEQALCERGCPKINLQIRTSNAAALSFYRAMGYVQDDVVSMGRRLITDD